MPNTQLPEKRVYYSEMLQVHSIFHTIQGEGPFAGRRALFVRLAGCNLQCPACDTEYSSERTMYPHTKLALSIRTMLKMKETDLVVITGGEPFRQPIASVVKYLLTRGVKVQIETNGTLYDPGLTVLLQDKHPFLTIVCSPKTGSLNSALFPFISAFKYVLKYDNVSKDGLPTKALDHPCASEVCRPPLGFPKERIYVQPLDEGDPVRNRLNMVTTVESSLKHGYTLCLQLHKYANLP